MHKLNMFVSIGAHMSKRSDTSYLRGLDISYGFSKVEYHLQYLLILSIRILSLSLKSHGMLVWERSGHKAFDQKYQSGIWILVL